MGDQPPNFYREILVKFFKNNKLRRNSGLWPEVVRPQGVFARSTNIKDIRGTSTPFTAIDGFSAHQA
jgi:hypothetical protein